MSQRIIKKNLIQGFSGPNTGISTEYGDTWDNTVDNLNAMFQELYGGVSGIDLDKYGAVGDGVTDDTQAVTNWLNALMATTPPSAGFAPPGVYLIKQPLPIITVPIGVYGAGPYKTWFKIDASMTGDVFSTTECWDRANYNGSTVVLPQFAGVIFKDFSVFGASSSFNQNAFMFYDRNDNVRFDNVDIYFMNGRAIGIGFLRNTVQAYMRESTFRSIKIFNCGRASLSEPVFELNSAGGGDGTNEIDITSLNIFAPLWTGVTIRSTGPGVRGIKFMQLRIEGLQNGTVAADLLQIGDPILTGNVNNIDFEQCELIDPYTSFAAVRFSAPNLTVAPYQCKIQGTIGGGLPNGSGINIDAGRYLMFELRGINTVGTNITVGPATMVGPPIVFNGFSMETTWTTNIDATSLRNVYINALIQGSWIGTSNSVDDTPTIQAALNAASSNGGGTVYLGPHRYLINSNLTIPTDTRLVGQYYPGGQRNDLSGNWGTDPYTLVLSTTKTITMNNRSALQNCLVLSTAWSLQTGIRNLINLVNGFAGTAITFATNQSDQYVSQVTIIGFNTAISVPHCGRPRIDNVFADCINGFLIDNVHDTGFITNCECTFYSTVNQSGSEIGYAISNVVDNGSGLYRVTLAAHAAVTGDKVYVTGVGGAGVANNKWTATVIDGTHIDLQGSASVSHTTTGNVVNTQNWIALTSGSNIAVGQTVTGTGIPGGTTVTAFWRSQNIVYLSAAATATNAGVTLTFTDPAYTSGGTLTLSANMRSGIGLSFTNGENLVMVGLAMQAYQTGFYMGAAAGWGQMLNCAVDHRGLDPTTVGFWFDSTSFNCSASGYVSSAGTAIRDTAAGHGDAGNRVVNFHVNSMECAFDKSGSTILEISSCTSNATGNSFFADNSGNTIIIGCRFNGNTFRYQTATGLAKLTMVGNVFATSAGQMLMTLPTVDPHIVGEWWANAGIVTISAG